ncbi:globin domain-containing protein [Fischerella thermalis]|uniref:globin domain-containing protein n=1 Tax=Fischerella thermalis TaxID=372787 RepID=UPI000C7FAC86|nr:globin domain-containing protein [Fischerella thermalis]PLZ32096.1 bacitracin resistance protein BacA [Fischerella thermalis WC559]PLZ34177.1 bacitracin resistance protein BacA [Fischerella thermalis WC558]PLZ39899.1 bacitracin resistance protein BacA [Fischerella thermalis WC542]PLZ60586.1 bacitracin resistance protein BacA [Fischerella thermalis WC442]PLZ62465.1 bacitracin resistance protein BacA [Fischerella thermalis WC439]
MVSQKTIEIVKATAPIIREKGEEITRRMYEITFAERPDYKRGFETTWMQHLDGGEQAHKLAAAVYAYATHIDRLDELAMAVEHIAHRHVETRILPEQYSLIGEKLLQAMKDVLQDAATDEVIAAWAEAYAALANIFIQKEKAIYQQEDRELTERLAKANKPETSS